MLYKHLAGKSVFLYKGTGRGLVAMVANISGEEVGYLYLDRGLLNLSLSKFSCLVDILTVSLLILYNFLVKKLGKLLDTDE